MHSSNIYPIWIWSHKRTLPVVFVFSCNFFAILAVWPEKWHKQWQSWQVKLWTKQASVWLTNQQICLMMQFIHFTPQHVVQWSSWANHLDLPLEIYTSSQYYSHNTVHYHTNWKEREKIPTRNSMPLSINFSSHIEFVIKYTESTVHALKNSSGQMILWLGLGD